MDTQLHVHEWIAVILLVALCAVLSLIALWNSNDESNLSSPLLVCDIEGWVRYPGSYSLTPGATVQDLLDRAQPLPEADLKGIRPKAKLTQGKCVVVKELPLITVHIQGAVHTPGPMQVHRGTREIDLLGLVAFKRNADLMSLKKKRRLRKGETIQVSSCAKSINCL